MEFGTGGASNRCIHRPGSPALAPGAAITRRQALKLGAATTLAATLGCTGTSVAGPPSYLVRASYAGLAGQRFTVGGRSLTLASITDASADWTEGWTAGDDDVFALRFEGPEGLGAEIHEFHHAALGRFRLYAGAIEAPERGVQRYEVVVDRSLKVRADRPERAEADPAPAVAPEPELTLAEEHAVYAALAEQIAAKDDEVDAADITPSRDQVRELRRTRRKRAVKPARKRRRTRKPVSRRRRAPRRRGTKRR